MLLISFCNERFVPEFVLGLLDPETSAFRWVDLQFSSDVKGAAGLASRNGYVYVGIQSQSPGPRLHIYDEVTLELAAAYDFRHIQDVHSMVFRDDHTLVAVSTGTDELYEMKLKSPTEIEEEQLLWRLPGTFAELGDQCHMNSVAFTSHGLTMTWCRSAGISASLPPSGGGVMAVESGQVIADGLISPHSLLEVEDALYVCADPGRVVKVGSGEAEIGGFARGLCELDGYLIAGSSGERTRSRSTDRMTKVTDFDEFALLGAWVSKIDPADMSVVETFSLKALGNEIYDLLPVASDFNATYAIDRDPYAERAMRLEYHLHALEA
ncbi:MAG: hypothetical protein DCC49_07755 [Acidobacteria bacterium]|nr:MAG: hypothetical protein DCC49_07755 [Acidobacteriota bacterium]